MQQLQRVIWQRKSTVLWQVWSRDEHSNRYVAHRPGKPRRSHHTYTRQTYLVRNISLRLVLRRRCGRRFYFWKDTSRAAANYHTLLLKHIPHCHSIVLPKGWMNRKTGLCWREAKRITAKSSQLHLKNEQYSNDQFVDQKVEKTT